MGRRSIRERATAFRARGTSLIKASRSRRMACSPAERNRASDEQLGKVRIDSTSRTSLAASSLPARLRWRSLRTCGFEVPLFPVHPAGESSFHPCVGQEWDRIPGLRCASAVGTWWHPMIQPGTCFTLSSSSGSSHLFGPRQPDGFAAFGPRAGASEWRRIGGGRGSLSLGLASCAPPP